MVKLVDTLDLGSSSIIRVGVQLPFLVFMQHLNWNLLSVIKNGFKARKKVIVGPSTFFCKQILKILYKEGYISGFRFSSDHSGKVEIFLKYNFGKPVVSKILSVSRPSRRVYVSVSDLWRLNTSFQTLVVSTSMGVLSDKDCRKFCTGGELLCIIN